MELVGRAGEGWGGVQVHRAVIMPLCPLIGLLEKDVTREDPKIILPGFPLELIQAFANLMYTGSTPRSAVVTVVNMLELMGSLGLNMPLDRLLVTTEESTDIELVGFKPRSGLEIIEVNNNTPTHQAILLGRSSLEITKTPLKSKTPTAAKRRHTSKIVQTPIIHKPRPAPIRPTKTVGKSREVVPEVDDESDIRCPTKTPLKAKTPTAVKRRHLSKIVQTPIIHKPRPAPKSVGKSQEVVPKVDDESDIRCPTKMSEVSTNPVGVETVPLLIKLECEETENLYDFEDFQQNRKRKRKWSIGDFQQTKKRKWTRRSETMQIQTHNCEFCDFKCRFFKDLQEHCDLFHSDKEFSCTKCEFKTGGLTLMKMHVKKMHIGVGDIVCEDCGFRAGNKRKMAYHKAKVCYSRSNDNLDEDAKADESQDTLVQALEYLGREVGDAKVETVRAVNKLESNETADMEITSKQSPIEKQTNEASSACDEDDANDSVKTKLSEVKDLCNQEGLKESVVADKVDEGNMFENIESLLREIPAGNQKSRNDANINEIIDDFENDNDSNMITDLSLGENLGIIANEQNSQGVDVVDELKNANVTSDNSKSGVSDTNLNDGETSKISDEVIGFKCSAPSCIKVYRVSNFTTATSALNRLRTHHAKIHTELEDSEVLYTILYKQATNYNQVVKKHKEASVKKVKEVSKDILVAKQLKEVSIDTPIAKQDEQPIEEDPLQILKKVKETHNKTATRSSSSSKVALQLFDGGSKKGEGY
eukprot:GFUD01017118.1.p1 GENE.GFUD01017118.1~~GFUD01017118.1.p1  ORF type:complete len:770 (+),score=192.61 GFUD01017118.1:31-2310(+)